MTHWTPEQRADAIGKALAVGADKAADMTGIPRRTISSWLNRERPAPELDGLIVSSRKQVAARLWEAVDVGTEQVLAGLRDPKARLGDKANALRIVAEQYQLITGSPTGINANVNVNAHADWFGGSDAWSEADLALQDQARDWTRALAEEAHVGYQALKAAGVESPDIKVDGLQVRAELSGYDMDRVRNLLNDISTAQEAGVSPSEILKALTAKKREGGGNG